MVAQSYRFTFGQKLAVQLDRRGWGAKTLARAMVERQNGVGDVEYQRRTIVRWLRGQNPVPHNRELVEDILGLPRDALKADEQDVEERSLEEFLVGDLLPRLREFLAFPAPGPEREAVPDDRGSLPRFDAPLVPGSPSPCDPAVAGSS